MEWLEDKDPELSSVIEVESQFPAERFAKEISLLVSKVTVICDPEHVTALFETSVLAKEVAARNGMV